MQYLKAKAEDNFRDAFARLKRGQPNLLPSDSPVSQNNVAKEAGCDPSALRKSRFPTLVDEIQNYLASKVGERSLTKRQQLLAMRKRSRGTRKVISDLREQRDQAASLMVEANSRISILTMRVRDLEARLEDIQTKPTVLALPTNRRKTGPRAMDDPPNP